MSTTSREEGRKAAGAYPPRWALDFCEGCSQLTFVTAHKSPTNQGFCLDDKCRRSVVGQQKKQDRRERRAQGRLWAEAEANARAKEEVDKAAQEELQRRQQEQEENAKAEAEEKAKKEAEEKAGTQQRKRQVPSRQGGEPRFAKAAERVTRF